HCNDFTTAEVGQYITLTENQQLTTWAMMGPPTLNSFFIQPNHRCDTAGAQAVPGGGARAYAITYEIETSGAPIIRCISS
ncbi:MAG TPA: hypothetical protein VD947_04760, partial [Patescibacteria group bacterium]|nr:hypothetical protein [Patescibacteria group bacterium]